MSKRYIWIITIGLFFCAVMVNAQTLGQVEKERDRRASLGIEHAGELITEVQLRSDREDENDADLETIVPEEIPRPRSFSPELGARAGTEFDGK